MDNPLQKYWNSDTILVICACVYNHSGINKELLDFQH